MNFRNLQGRAALCAAFLAALSCASALAAGTNNRTFVSVEGSDSYSCAAPVVNAALLSGPCRTIQGAIAKVIDYGEVIILDSGNYGNGGPPLVISQNVTIKTPPGVLATMSSNQQDAVEIQQAVPGTPITVNLIGFQLNGLAANTRSGIYINNPGGSVHLEGCVITNVPGAGIEIAAGAFALSSAFVNDNGTGLQIGTGGVSGIVEGGSLSNNNIGLAVTDLADLRLSEVSIEGNAQYGIQVAANTAAGNPGTKLITNHLRLNFNGVAALSLSEACTACNTGGGVAGMVLDNSVVLPISISTANIDGIQLSGPVVLLLHNDQIGGSGAGHALNISNSPNSATTPTGSLVKPVRSNGNNLLYGGLLSTGPVLIQAATGGAATECTPATATPCGIGPLNTTY